MSFGERVLAGRRELLDCLHRGMRAIRLGANAPGEHSGGARHLVARLHEGTALWAIEYFVLNVLAAYSRQVMEKDRSRRFRDPRHQLSSDSERTEALAPVRIGFRHAHRLPAGRVDNIDA